MGVVRVAAVAAAIAALAACHSRSVPDRESLQALEPVVRAALTAERDAFVRGDAEAVLRASGLDTAHWPAVRIQVDASIRRREFLLRSGLDYHAVLEARTTVDSARLTSDTATLWVTAWSLYAHRLIGADTMPGPSMGEAVPHVFSFVRRHGAWSLVRDSIVSLAELHRRMAGHPIPGGPTIPIRPTGTPTVRGPAPTRERPGGDTARRRVHDRNAMDADIARGPVPGYAGVIIEGGCTIVLLTDTLMQKAAAEAFFRSDANRHRLSVRSNCGGLQRLGFRQVRYDFAQLYDWYVGPFREIWAQPGVTMTDIDESRNQLAVGVVDSAAYHSVRRFVETLPIPHGALRVHVAGKVCVGTGGPSVMVEVRDPKGRPAAIGTTIVIQDGAFKDSVDGAHPHSELHVGAGERRPGRYEVRLYKPGYRAVVLRDVIASGDEACQYAEPSDVRKVTLELLPDAPNVRSVVVLPPGMGFGLPKLELQLRAVVDADSGVSTAVRWASSDTTVATISATGLLRSACRALTGNAVITATSLVDPHVRGQASVSVRPPDGRGLRLEQLSPATRECVEKLRDR